MDNVSDDAKPGCGDEQGGLDADDGRGIREAAAAFRDLVQETHIEKVYWYWSIKAHQYVEVRGDTALMMLVLDEFDPNVVRIEVEAPTAVESVDGEPTGTRFDATVTHRDGSTVLKEAKRKEALEGGDARTTHQIEAQRQAAARRGATYELVIDETLRRRAVRFWNCLALLGWFNRGRGISTSSEEKALQSYLDGKSGARLEELLALPDLDPALVLAVLARQAAFGALHVDLNRPLTRRSYFSTSKVEEPTEVSSDRSLEQSTRVNLTLPPSGDFGDVPLQMLDMKRWPRVDEAFVRNQKDFVRRRDAVVMFYEGQSAAEIKDRTGLDASGVKALVLQCAAPGIGGNPKGFPALVKFGYLRSYKRKAPSARSNRVLGAQGGWSGELERLLAMHPDLIDLLADLTLEHGKSVGGKRLKWSDIRDAFVKACETKIDGKGISPEKRLTRSSYPFSTKKLGYYSIIKFCKELKKGKRSRWVAKRFGEAAAKRAMLGSGRDPLFVPTAPYQAAAGDFYKVDVETAIQQDLPDGTTLDVILPRWSIGSIVCMHGGFPIVESLSLELQQTTEDVLALGERIVSTPPPCQKLAGEYRNTSDGKWLPGQLVPALANNGIDLLFVDRAWSNQAHQGLAKLSQATGAVIGFCASGAWEQKAPVERHFADVVSALHTVPSSVGSGPKDFRRKGASQMAVRYQINVERIVQRVRAEMRKILSHKGAGSFGLGHIERLHQLALNHESHWLPRPIPKARVDDNPLQWIDLDATIVAGTESNHRAPHVRPLGVRFYGDSLARREDLIGRGVVVQIKREHFNQARVVLSRVGEILGSVRPERRYNVDGLTYRMVRLILQKQSVTDIDDAISNPALDFAEKNKAVVAARRKKTRSPGQRPRPVRGHREGLIGAALESAALDASAAAEPTAGSPASPLQGLTPTEFSVGSFSRKQR